MLNCCMLSCFEILLYRFHRRRYRFDDEKEKGTNRCRYESSSSLTNIVVTTLSWTHDVAILEYEPCIRGAGGQGSKYVRVQENVAPSDEAKTVAEYPIPDTSKRGFRR